MEYGFQVPEPGTPWALRSAQIEKLKATHPLTFEFGNDTDVLWVPQDEQPSVLYQFEDKAKGISPYVDARTAEDVENAVFERMSSLFVTSRTRGTEAEEVMQIAEADTKKWWQNFFAQNTWWMVAEKQAAEAELVPAYKNMIVAQEPKDLFRFFPWLDLTALLVANYGAINLDHNAERNLGKFITMLHTEAPLDLREVATRLILMEPKNRANGDAALIRPGHKTMFIDRRIITHPRGHEKSDDQETEEHYRKFIGNIVAKANFKDTDVLAGDFPDNAAPLQRVRPDAERRLLDRRIPYPIKIAASNLVIDTARTVNAVQ